MTYGETVDRARRLCRKLTVLGAAKILGVRRDHARRFLNGQNIQSRAYFRILTTLELAETIASHRTNQLTPHEITVMRRLSQGLCRKEIAAEVKCSPKAVDAALKNIARKIGLQEVNVALITRWAIAKGF